MTKLRYIRLPTSTGKERVSLVKTESNPAVSIDEESGISCATATYSARNRYRPMPTPQAAQDPRTVVASIQSHDLHCHPRYSQPKGLSWGKVQRSVRAVWQRIKQRMRRGIHSQDDLR